MEAGYGAPEVVVERCLLTDNKVGLRFGDDYERLPEGRLHVSGTLSIFNDIDLKESDEALDVAGKIELTHSVVSQPQALRGDTELVPADWNALACGYGDGATRVGPAEEVCLRFFPRDP